DLGLHRRLPGRLPDRGLTVPGPGPAPFTTGARGADAPRALPVRSGAPEARPSRAGRAAAAVSAPLPRRLARMGPRRRGHRRRRARGGARPVPLGGPEVRGQPQHPPPQQPPPPAGSAATPPTATRDSSFTVSSCPCGQLAGSADSAIGRDSSKDSPQVRQAYSYRGMAPMIRTGRPRGDGRGAPRTGDAPRVMPRGASRWALRGSVVLVRPPGGACTAPTAGRRADLR